MSEAILRKKRTKGAATTDRAVRTDEKEISEAIKKNCTAVFFAVKEKSFSPYDRRGIHFVLGQALDVAVMYVEDSVKAEIYVHSTKARKSKKIAAIRKKLLSGFMECQEKVCARLGDEEGKRVFAAALASVHKNCGKICYGD